MLLVKELNGLIYAASIGPALSPLLPGVIAPWVPIGPGLGPVLTWEGDRCLVAFDYLGHTYVRRLDTTVWPPQVVDPVTYTPHISIQEPHDALSLQVRSAPMAVWIGDETMPGVGLLHRTSTMVFDPDRNEFSTSISRDTSVNPFPATRKKWRLYIRAIGASAWTLLIDWIPELPDVPLVAVGVMKIELACTYGHLWTPTYRDTDPDLSGGYRESAMGKILTIDSDLEAKTWRQHPAETLLAPMGAMPGFWLDSRIVFNSSSVNELNPHSAHSALGCAGMEFPRSEEFRATAALEALPFSNSATGTVLLYS